MAPRATWKGFLKISLVNIPIKVFPATESTGSISFNQLHGECQTRIEQKRWCPQCNREVPNTEIVKGYEFEKGRYAPDSRAEPAAAGTIRGGQLRRVGGNVAGGRAVRDRGTHGNGSQGRRGKFEHADGGTLCL